MSERFVAGTRLGPYQIEGLIGEGGMGQVFRALDTRLGRRVAIKTMSDAGAVDPGRVARFETEARAAGAVDHPNLLVVYDVGREGPTSYIVSELLEGTTLRTRLLDGPMPERQVLEFASQMADGLAAAHERGIVHRDLKPENLFVTNQRRLKILDFGVAKLTQASEPDLATVTSPPVTGVGAAVGTVGYMAPEQVRGEPVDHRADIFALGVVVHEMLSGAAPFRRDSAPETLTAILREDPPELPSVTPSLQRVLRQCLQKEPADRFHSAHDLAVAFRLVPSIGSGTSLPVNPPATLTRRRVLVYGASSLALAGAGLASGMWLGGRRRPAAAPSFRRVTFRRGLIRGSRLAPDGQTVLYGAHWDGGPCRVHLSRMDRPESHTLDLPDANMLAISRTGEIALALGSHMEGIMPYGTLARVPMAGGVPRQMLEDVKSADWSPDGASLAIVRRVDGRDRLEFPIGNVLVAPGPGEGSLAFPRVSPDARNVAYLRHHGPGNLSGRVEMVDAAGSVTTLSGDYLNIHGLAWKGDEVWFTAADERPLFRSLWAVAPGGVPRTIARTPSNGSLWDVSPDGRLLMAHSDERAVLIVNRPDDDGERDMSWLDSSVVEDLSHDGRLMLFTEGGHGGGTASSVYVRGTDGSPAVRLGDGRAIALSPDGRWALCAARDVPSPYLEIVPTGTGEPRRISAGGLGYIAARWLPDGERLVVSATERGHGVRLYLHGLGSGPPVALTPEGVRGGWSLSPDGKTLAAIGPGPAIRLYPVDGGASRELAGMTGGEVPIGWIRDGLLIRRPGQPGTSLGDVFRVDTETGRQEFWKNILPRDRAGLLNLGGFHTPPDGRTQAYTWYRAIGTLYVADGLG